MRGLQAVVSSLVLALSLGACRLTEVATSEGEEVLVVDAQLRALSTQRAVVLLHHALNGRVVRGESGAQVAITGPDGQTMALQERPIASCADRLSAGATDSLRVEATCYTDPDRGAIAIVPGATYELSVLTRDGARARGRTTVPGPFDFRVPTPGAIRQGTCILPPNTNLPFVWTLSAGAWSYLSSVEVTGLRSALASQGIDVRERIELSGLSISERDTTLVLPAQFGIFELGDLDPRLVRLLQNGFPNGVNVRFTMAAVDRNFVNAVRGGNFNPSGTTRIPSVVGDAVGVFASFVPKELAIQVRTPGFTATPACIPRT